MINKCIFYSSLSGAENILIERHRQINFECWADSVNEIGDLSNFACCYAIDPKGGDATNIIKTLKPNGWQLKLSCNGNTEDDIDGRIKDLIKAGACLAAEIDKLKEEQKSRLLKLVKL